MVEGSLGQFHEEVWISKVAWRIVGASESPLKILKLTPLINNLVSKYVPCQ